MNSSIAATPPHARLGTPLDERMLALAAPRDPAAFTQLYRRYLAPVYRYSLARVGSVEDAQDLTSQTFLAALEGIGRYRAESAFSTWLFGIAKNKCADLLRHRRASGNSLSIEDADAMPSPDPQPDQAVEGIIRVEQVARAARTLPPEQGEALALRIHGGLSAAEVGQVMGKSEAAAKMLVHRAVCGLRARLGSRMEDEG